jgi:hypothetical protein
MAALGAAQTAEEVAEAEEWSQWFQTAHDCADDRVVDCDLDDLRELDVPKFINRRDGGEHGPAGWGALHYAAAYGNYEMARFLLKHGAWPGPVVSASTPTVIEEPEDIARENEHKNIADLINHVREAGGWNNYINTPPARLQAHQAALDQRFP